MLDLFLLLKRVQERVVDFVLVVFYDSSFRRGLRTVGSPQWGAFSENFLAVMVEVAWVVFTMHRTKKCTGLMRGTLLTLGRRQQVSRKTIPPLIHKDKVKSVGRCWFVFSILNPGASWHNELGPTVASWFHGNKKTRKGNRKSILVHENCAFQTAVGVL